MPKDPRAFLQLAEEHRRAGRLEEAIAVCIEGLGRHPGLDAARITLGRAYLESGQFDRARETLEEVFTRLPEHHLAGKLLAEAQHLLGDRTAAEATCRALLARYPRDREIETILESLASEPGNTGMPVDPARSGAATTAPAPAEEPVAPPAAATVVTTPGEAADPEPEYMPEDVDLGPARAGMTPPRGPVPGPVAAAGPARPAPARPAPAQPAPVPPTPTAPAVSSPVAATPAVSPVASTTREEARQPLAAGGDVLQTSTLADLYLRQGLVDRAIEVYKAMLRVDPRNERARKALAEIESGPPQGGFAAAARPVTPAARTERETPTTVAPHAVDPRAAAIDRLERWLDTVKRGSVRAGRSGQ